MTKQYIDLVNRFFKKSDLEVLFVQLLLELNPEKYRIEDKNDALYLDLINSTLLDASFLLVFKKDDNLMINFVGTSELIEFKNSNFDLIYSHLYANIRRHKLEMFLVNQDKINIESPSIIHDQKNDTSNIVRQDPNIVIDEVKVAIKQKRYELAREKLFKLDISNFTKRHHLLNMTVFKNVFKVSTKADKKLKNDILNTYKNYYIHKKKIDIDKKRDEGFEKLKSFNYQGFLILEFLKINTPTHLKYLSEYHEKLKIYLLILDFIKIKAFFQAQYLLEEIRGYLVYQRLYLKIHQGILEFREQKIDILMRDNLFEEVIDFIEKIDNPVELIVYKEKALKLITDYINAQRKFEEREYDECIKLLENIVKYKDAKTIKQKCIILSEINKEYNDAINLFNEKKYEEALEKFKRIPDYLLTKAYIEKIELFKHNYDEAMKCVKLGNYRSASELFLLSNGYKDSKEHIKIIKNTLKKFAKQEIYNNLISLIDDGNMIEAEEKINDIDISINNGMYKDLKNDIKYLFKKKKLQLLKEDIENKILNHLYEDAIDLIRVNDGIDEPLKEKVLLSYMSYVSENVYNYETRFQLEKVLKIIFEFNKKYVPSKSINLDLVRDLYDKHLKKELINAIKLGDDKKIADIYLNMSEKYRSEFKDQVFEVRRNIITNQITKLFDERKYEDIILMLDKNNYSNINIDVSNFRMQAEKGLISQINNLFYQQDYDQVLEINNRVNFKYEKVGFVIPTIEENLKKYKIAETYFINGDYDNYLKEIKNIYYKDAKRMREVSSNAIAKYNEALKLGSINQYDLAIEILDSISDYQKSKALKDKYLKEVERIQSIYETAVECFKSNQLDESKLFFSEIKGFNDVDDYLKKIKELEFDQYGKAIINLYNEKRFDDAWKIIEDNKELGFLNLISEQQEKLSSVDTSLINALKFLNDLNLKYEDAMKDFAQYRIQKAKQKLMLIPNFKNSDKKINECNEIIRDFQDASSSLEEGMLDSATKIYKKYKNVSGVETRLHLINHIDDLYNKAVFDYYAGNYISALNEICCLSNSENYTKLHGGLVESNFYWNGKIKDILESSEESADQSNQESKKLKLKEILSKWESGDFSISNKQHTRQMLVNGELIDVRITRENNQIYMQRIPDKPVQLPKYEHINNLNYKVVIFNYNDARDIYNKCIEKILEKFELNLKAYKYSDCMSLLPYLSSVKDYDMFKNTLEGIIPTLEKAKEIAESGNYQQSLHILKDIKYFDNVKPIYNEYFFKSIGSQYIKYFNREIIRKESKNPIYVSGYPVLIGKIRGKTRDLSKTWTNIVFYSVDSKHLSVHSKDDVVNNFIQHFKKLDSYLFLRSHVYIVLCIEDFYQTIDPSNIYLYKLNHEYAVENNSHVYMNELQDIDLSENFDDELSKMKDRNLEIISCVKAYDGTLEIYDKTQKNINNIIAKVKNNRKRLIIEGPARSGKTIIAMSLLRNFPESILLMMNYHFFKAIKECFKLLNVTFPSDRIFHHDLNKDRKEGCIVSVDTHYLKVNKSFKVDLNFVIVDEAQRLSNLNEINQDGYILSRFDELDLLATEPKIGIYFGDDRQRINPKYDQGLKTIKNVLKKNEILYEEIQYDETIGIPNNLIKAIKYLLESKDEDVVKLNHFSIEVISDEDEMIRHFVNNNSKSKHFATLPEYPLMESWTNKGLEIFPLSLKNMNYDYFLNERVQNKYVLSTYEMISREVESLYIILPISISYDVKDGISDSLNRINNEFLLNHLYVLMTRANQKLIIFTNNLTLGIYLRRQLEKLY